MAYSRLTDDVSNGLANRSDLRWEASLISAELVPAGPWSKHQRLKLDLGESLPREAAADISDLTGKRMTPLLAVMNHATFGGLWRVVSANPAREGITSVNCVVPKYEGPFKPQEYAVTVTNVPQSNVCVSPLDASKPSADSRVALAPPLTFHARMSIINVDEINVVSQSFRAQVYVEMRLRSIATEDDRALIQHILDSYGFRTDMLQLMGVIEVIGEMEQWEGVRQI